MQGEKRKVSLAVKIAAFFPFVPIIIMLAVFAFPDENRPYVVNLTGEWKVMEGDNYSWRLPGLDDTKWQKIKFPGRFEKQGYLNRIVWIRKKIRLKPAMVGEKLFLMFGRTYSGFGWIYVNGKLVKKIGRFKEMRKPEGTTRQIGLPIKKGIFKEGVNQIAIRFYWNLLSYDGINDPRFYLGTENVLKPYYDSNVDFKTFFQYGIVFFGIFMLVILGALYFSEGRGGGDQKKYVITALYVLSAVLYNFFYSGLGLRLIATPTFAAVALHTAIMFICITVPEFFLYYFYRRKNRFVTINRIIVGIFFIARLVSPDWLMFKSYSLFVLYFFGVIMYAIFISIKALITEEEHRYGYGVLMISSLLVGALVGVGDLLANLGIIHAPSMFNISISNILLMGSLVALLDFIRISNTNKRLTVSLRELNLNLEHKVEERTQDLKEARDALWGEMQLAKKIQTVLLPEEPAIEGYQIAASMMPADEVGGDYYDVVNVNGMDWLVIGDVSGHGVPAGLVMMMVQTAFRVTLERSPTLSPAELLETVNRTISHNIKQLGEDKYMTITVFAAHQDGRFTFSGLHQDILVYRAANKQVESIETKGMWIGVMDDIKGMVQDDSLHLEKDDVMLIYTDGLTEAEKEGQMYGEEQLATVFNSLCGLSAEEIRSGIISSLGGYGYADDVTLMVLKKI